MTSQRSPGMTGKLTFPVKSLLILRTKVVWNRRRDVAGVWEAGVGRETWSQMEIWKQSFGEQGNFSNIGCPKFKTCLHKNPDAWSMMYKTSHSKCSTHSADRRSTSQKTWCEVWCLPVAKYMEKSQPSQNPGWSAEPHSRDVEAAPFPTPLPQS